MKVNRSDQVGGRPGSDSASHSQKRSSPIKLYVDSGLWAARLNCSGESCSKGNAPVGLLGQTLGPRPGQA